MSPAVIYSLISHIPTQLTTPMVATLPAVVVDTLSTSIRS